MSGSRSAREISALSFMTIARGVPAGRDHALPRRRFVTGKAGLRDGREFRQGGEPLGARDREPFRFSASNMRQHDRRLAERELYMPAQQIRQRERRALVRYVRECYARHRLEKFDGEMRAAAGTGRAEIEPAGLRFRQRDEFAQVVRRQRRMHRRQIGRHHHQRDRCEVAQRIVRQIRHHAHVGCHGAHRTHEQGVTVRRRFRGDHRGDSPAAARSIVDDYLLTETLVQFLAQCTRDDIRHAAWCEADDEAYGFTWITLR